MPNLRRRYDEGAWTVQDELERYRSLRPCPACGGARLKAGEPGRAREGPIDPGVRRPAGVGGAPGLRRHLAHRSRGDHRGADPARGAGSAAVPRRGRRGLPHARPQRRHPVRRRGAAHPAGDADRIEPHRRAVRPRRAVDRPAPARQPCAARDAAAPARSRQLGHRRRTRRGDHPDGGLRGRSRAGRRRARRPGHLPGHAHRARRVGSDLGRPGRTCAASSRSTHRAHAGPR